MLLGSQPHTLMYTQEALLAAAVMDPNISVLVLGCFAALVCASHVLFGPAFGGKALLQCMELLKSRIRQGSACPHQCRGSGRTAADTALEPEEATNTDARVARNCVVFTMLLFSRSAPAPCPERPRLRPAAQRRGLRRAALRAGAAQRARR